MSKTEVVKILSKYKNAYMKKKNDIIRKIVRTLQGKSNTLMNSVLQEIKILGDKDILKEDLPFLRTYEEVLISELLNIYNKNENRRSASVEEEMRKIY